MRLSNAALFTAGYIVGARAGRERYAQIVELAQRASQRLEQFSVERPPGRQDHRSGRAGGGSRPRETPI